MELNPRNPIDARALEAQRSVPERPASNKTMSNWEFYELCGFSGHRTPEEAAEEREDQARRDIEWEEQQAQKLAEREANPPKRWKRRIDPDEWHDTRIERQREADRQREDRERETQQRYGGS